MGSHSSPAPITAVVQPWSPANSRNAPHTCSRSFKGPMGSGEMSPRRPMVGMMLHQDGSRHLWIEALGRPLDLIVTLDDATSAIYSAFLAEEEGTASSFRGLREVVEAHGLFCSLYTDRGSHYFHRS